MDTSTIVSLLVLFVGYSLVDYFYLKKHLGINSKWKWMFSDERSKIAIVIDVILFAIFTSIQFKYILEPEYFNYPLVVQIIPLLALTFLQGILQGFEEFLTNRSEKTHHRHWLGALMVAFTYVIIYI